MYDTEMRVKLVKKRILEKQRRREKHNLYGLSALSVVLLVSLTYTFHVVSGMGKAAVFGMYGSILMHEDAGGYILVGILAFTAAVIITLLCIRYKESQRMQKQDGKKKKPPQD